MCFNYSKLEMCFNYSKPENPHDSVFYETDHEYLWDTQAGFVTHSFLHDSIIEI